MLSVFDGDASVAMLADWVELDHLISGRMTSTASHVIRADRVVADEIDHGGEFDEESAEIVEIEIAEPARDQRVESIWTELSERQDRLKDAYPFVVTGTTTGWSLVTRRLGTGPDRAARLAYSFALIAASFRHRHILKQDADPATWLSLEKEMANLFQAVSVLAANNIFGSKTEVYSFGFPRHDKTGFAAALVDLVSKIGHGQIRDTAPQGTEHDQDATVDLIAWRSFMDRTYGTIIVYGQVASGSNWAGKSAFSHLAGRFFQHFVDEPSRHYLGATFIPFVLHTNVKPPKGGDYAGAVVDAARAIEADHGIVVDRLRMSELLLDGVADATRRHNAPAASVTARAILRWIRAVRLYCTGAL